MAMSAEPVTFDTKEKTFTKFTPSQAGNYSQHRRNYHASVYNHILQQHISTGGDLDHVLDIGWFVPSPSLMNTHSYC